MNPHLIDIELPGVLGVIARSVGLEVALRLARIAGGTQINIPKTMRETSKIATIVGLEAAEAIRAEVGHGKIVVPMTDLRGRAAKRLAAIRLLEEGLSIAEVAHAIDVHERTVFRIRRQHRKDQDQLAIRGG